MTNRSPCGRIWQCRQPTSGSVSTIWELGARPIRISPRPSGKRVPAKGPFTTISSALIVRIDSVSRILCGFHADELILFRKEAGLLGVALQIEKPGIEQAARVDISHGG